MGYRQPGSVPPMLISSQSCLGFLMTRQLSSPRGADQQAEAEAPATSESVFGMLLILFHTIQCGRGTHKGVNAGIWPWRWGLCSESSCHFSPLSGP